MSRPTSSTFSYLNGLLLVIVLLCILFQIINSTQERRNGFSFKMIYRDSLHSPLYHPNLTENERIERLIRISKTRFNSLSTKMNISSQVLEQPQGAVRPSMYRQDFVYMVQVGIGQFNGRTPYLNYYLELDTGSDVTWTQCAGCRTCFHQRDPYFPRNISRTYHSFPCNECPSSSRCELDHCTFTMSYGDGSNVNGIWASETFTFESDLDVETIPNLVFGCGIEMHNFLIGQNPNNVISGLLGMSYGPMSFASQLKNRDLGEFSYCLQPLSTPPGPGVAPMFLRFGEDIVRVPGMAITSLKKVGNSPYYHINLEDLSVGVTRLNIPPSVFAVKPDNSGGTMIDSGAALSHIVPQAFEVLLNAIATFIKFNNPNMIQIPPPISLPACWQRFSDPPEVNLPSVTFHLENADMVVQPESVFLKGQTSSQYDMYCVAILRSSPPMDSLSQLGAYQQGNQRIIYEINSNQLVFGAADCSHAN